MENFLLKKGQEDILKNILAGERFDYTKTSVEKDIEEFLDELSKGKKKIDGFEVLPSEKAILTNALFSKRNSTSYKGINSLLIYMLIRDKQTYITDNDKPNFKFDDINAFLSDCINTTTVSDTNHSRFRRLIEKFSEQSNFGKCTLTPKKNGQSIQLIQVIQDLKEDSLIKGYTKHSSINFEEMPLELYHLREYEKESSISELFLLKIVRGLPLWLKKFFFKEAFGKIPQIGDSQLVRQKIEYYIPLEFEFLGNEYDKLSDKETKRLQKKVEKGLLNYLWDSAIMGREAKYFFVFAGIGQGKTSLLVKLYIQYHRFIFDSINERIIGYFNIDDTLENKLDIFNQQVKYLSQTKGKTFEKIVLLDALDEDYEANIDISKRLDNLKKILDSYDCVIITCRTQFFDSQKDIEREIRERFGDRETRIAYIRRFNPKQINKYLKKRYKFRSNERKIANELITKYSDKRDFISQPLLLSFMDLLVRHKSEERLEIEHKTQLYKYIIDRWLEKEATKKSISKANIENYKSKIYNVAHQVAMNIYKRDIIKATNLKNNTVKIGNALSNDELTTMLKKIDTDVLEIKKRSVFMRDTIGNWFFTHNSFLTFFIGHAAYQIPEFDTIFDYHKGFEPFNKKDQNSASFFYLELMWLKIQNFNNLQNYHTIFCRNKNGLQKTIDQVKLFELPLITILNQRIPTHITNSADISALWAEEQSTLVEWIRCLKNLKQSIKFDFQSNFQFHINMIGNMKSLEIISIFDSNVPINLKELIKFENLFSLRLRGLSIINLHAISHIKNIRDLYIWRCDVQSTEWDKFNSPNDIERLELKNSNTDDFSFLKYWVDK